MLSYECYKVVHLLGVIMLFLSLGGLVVASSITEIDRRWARRLGITHGLGLLMVLFAGFGMLAKLQIMAHLPGWAIGKLIIWLCLGGMIALVRRKPQWGILLWWTMAVLGGLAAYLALYKPF